MVADHHLQLVLHWRKIPLIVDLDKSAEGRVQTPQQHLPMFKDQLTVFVADHSFWKLNVAVWSFSDFDGRVVVEVDDVLFDFGAVFVLVAEHDEGRVD